MKKPVQRSASWTRLARNIKSPPPAAKRSPTLTILVAGMAVAAVAGATLWFGFFGSKRSPNFASRPGPRGVTFNRDVAPIVFRNCSGCHRPGQSAPFSLLQYSEIRKRAEQIGEVTAKRIMPPWLPESAPGEFANDRQLSPDEIQIIQQWVAEGCVEGNAADLPPLPSWPDGWQLGRPDLVVQMPQAYTLEAAGPDVYRNFAISVSVVGTRFVQAVEFHPGNPKIVHHAFLKMDRSGESRRLDEQGAGCTAIELRLKPVGRSVLAEPSKEQSLNRFAARRDGLALPTELPNSTAVGAG